MARPVKKGLDYFPLDCKLDDEVNLIVADFGIEGFGVLVSMFQFIYSSKGYYTDWTIREQKLFSKRVGLDFELSTSIINECIVWGIFNEKMFNEFQVLTSRRIQEHYATSTYKRVGVEMYENYLMIDVNDKKHINKGVCDDGNKATTIVTDDESTQSIVQYSTVKKIKEKESTKPVVDSKEPTLIDAFFNDCWKIYPNKKGKGQIKPARKKNAYSLGEEFKRTIERYAEEQRGKEKQFMQNGSTFWNGGYVDYLDINFSEATEEYDSEFYGSKEEEEAANKRMYEELGIK